MKKINKTNWIKGFIVCASLLALSLLFNSHPLLYDDQEDFLPSEMCSQVEFIPSWIQDGKIIGYGKKNDFTVEYLIENQISFLYNPRCIYCEKQIDEIFGEQGFSELESKGYTINYGEVPEK